MKADELADLLEQGATHRLILGNRMGPYALGVTESPDSKGDAALLLKIGDATGFPSHVDLAGQKVRLLVQGGFKAPVPLKSD